MEKIKITLQDTKPNITLRNKTEVNLKNGTTIVASNSHNDLRNLDYENSGHTGFASSLELDDLKRFIDDLNIIASDETLNIEKFRNRYTIDTQVIVAKETIYEFPNRGIEKALYVEKSTKKIFIWLNGEYVALNDYIAINEQIDYINGGDASGR